jgi:hypothetical protein
MMAQERKEINGNQQAKNPGKAEAATDGKVFIKGRERASCGAEPNACEEVVVRSLLTVLMPALPAMPSPDMGRCPSV